jgi:hypothetical protein
MMKYTYYKIPRSPLTIGIQIQKYTFQLKKNTETDLLTTAINTFDTPKP